MLTCSKFLTTSDYAPRLRQRLTSESTLIADAAARGWDREVRHQRTAHRLAGLLSDSAPKVRIDFAVVELDGNAIDP